MKLNKIYTSPKKLFDDVVFHNGLNIIFAHKPVQDSTQKQLFDESKESLHAVGKSTLIDLILFALLFDFEKSSPRLNNAYHKKILHGISVILEFSVDDKDYYIKRSFDHPNAKIYFGPINKGKSFTLGKLREELFNLIFFRKDYTGESNRNWYYKLFSFFIKVKKREELFNDPIEFSRNLSELEFTPFHLFLLNINNSIPSEHKNISEALNKLNSFLNEQQNFLKEKSETKDLTKLENKRIGLKNTITKLEKRISNFSLVENYSELQNQADSLTSEIKNLWFRNAIDKHKLDDLVTYDKATPPELYENITLVTNIYNKVNSLLAGNIKKSLQDVVSFRKSLYESRKDFVLTEKGRLNTNIYNRSENIAALENIRKKVFDELSEQNALDELTNTYTKLANIQKEYSEIESSLKDIDKTKDDIIEKRNEQELLIEKIPTYLVSISTAIIDFRELLKSVYSQLFLDSHIVKIFDITETLDKQKIKISVLQGSIIDSTGINQVRTLIYDIAVLLNIINKQLNAPHFIIHDGIFENLDKSHFFAFIKYIDELLAKDTEFQYILTLNDHDFLNEDPNFKEKKIIANSIIKLTPQKTLLGKEF